MRLNPEQREGLLHELSASLDATDLGEYWEGEIRRRISDVDSGKINTVPSDEVFARLAHASVADRRVRFNPSYWVGR